MRGCLIPNYEFLIFKLKPLGYEIDALPLPLFWRIKRLILIVNGLLTYSVSFCFEHLPKLTPTSYTYTHTHTHIDKHKVMNDTEKHMHTKDSIYHAMYYSVAIAF